MLVLAKQKGNTAERETPKGERGFRWNDGALPLCQRRLAELDVLCGILLLMMVVNHSPSSLRCLTDQPLGFFTTAEAFVFVSAFLAGMLFCKRMENDGFDAARSSTIHRAGRIYCADLLTLTFAFAVGSFLLTYLPGLQTLLGK